MEKRLTQKVDNYILEYKESIKNWCLENTHNDNIDSTLLINFINNHNKLIFEKDDFQRRKRTKNVIPQYVRCCARRANGEQCTRKKKNDISYCGTHEKNRPHGVINDVCTVQDYKKIEIWLQEINGILYYIDSNKNVYKSEDILNNIINPTILYKYKIIDNNYYLDN